MKKHIIATVVGVAVLGFSSWGIISFRIARHRSMSNACVGNQRQIDSAKEQWAMQTGTTNGPVDVQGMLFYVKGGMPICPAGGTYTIGAIGEDPTCSVHGGMLHRRYPNWWE